MTAGNQCGKSLTNLRLCTLLNTDLSTRKRLIKKKPLDKPLLTWYLLPGRQLIQRFFDNKWSMYLPQGEYKTNKATGWWLRKTTDGFPNYIEWVNGNRCYFFPYTSSPSLLQSDSVDAIFIDEEIQYPLFEELKARLNATGGILRGVFTHTQKKFSPEWYQVVERVGLPDEKMKEAFKKRVTLYDCLKFPDGTKGHYTIDEIKKIEDSCVTEAEKLARVYGHYVRYDDILFKSFSRKKNIITMKEPPPKDWIRYVGVDYGTGSRKSYSKCHPSAIMFLAVSPDYKEGVFYKCWRGDHQETTISDVVDKLEALMYREPNIKRIFYDHSARALYLEAARSKIYMKPAGKSRTEGFQFMEKLFKNGQLKIGLMEGDVEQQRQMKKFIYEVQTLSEEEMLVNPRNKKGDDLTDAGVYVVFPYIPWVIVKQSSKTIDKKDDKDSTSKVEYTVSYEKEREEAHRLFEENQRRASRGSMIENDMIEVGGDYWI